MYAATDIAEGAKSRRRWQRFSLRSLLLLTLLVAVFLASLGNLLLRLHHQRSIVNKIQSLGGEVYYDYQHGNVDKSTSVSPPGSKVLRFALGDDAFAYVESVYFGLTSPSTQTDADLAILLDLPRLQRVALDGTNVTDEGMEHVGKIQELRYLTLSNTNVTSSGLRQLQSANGLVSLSLSGGAVDDDALSALDQFPDLQSLQLFRTNVTSAGMKHVANLAKLKDLDVTACSAIADDGLEILADLAELEVFRLHGTSVSDRGLVHLRMLHRLRTLDLSQTSVSDAGLHHLIELPLVEDFRAQRLAELR